MKKRLVFLSTLFLIALTGTAALADGTFEVLPFESFFPSGMRANYDGTVLMGFGNNYYSPDTGWIVIDGGQPGNVSGDGMTVIGTNTDPDTGLETAALWTAADGWATFLEPVAHGESCGSSLSSGYALTFDAAQGVGLAWVANCKAEGFLWTAGMGSEGLGRTGEGSSRATDISDDGSVIVGFDEHAAQGYRRPALWTADVVGPQLFAGEETMGEGYAVTSDGSMICGEVNNPDTYNNEAMYYDADNGVVLIGALPGETAGSGAYGISDDGKVVGTSGDPWFSWPSAIIWTAELGLMPMADFLAAEGVEVPEGFHLYSTLSISADGNTITGAGIEDGAFSYNPWVVHLNGGVGVEGEIEEELEQDNTPAFTTALKGNHPNPFNPQTTVFFTLDRPQHVRLSVIDLQGHRVAVLADGEFGMGEHPVLWNGTDTQGKAAPSGTYLIQMETEDGVQGSKMSLVR